jgi:hypothetical protein
MRKGIPNGLSAALLSSAVLLGLLLAVPPALAAHVEDGVEGTSAGPGQGKGKPGPDVDPASEDPADWAGAFHRPDPNAGITAHDADTAGMVISDGPFADVIKNLAIADRGERLLPNATSDVWALDGFAYVGTFNIPCGDGTGANGSGIRIFDVQNPNVVPDEVGVVPSLAGSRTNDVKVADMNSGTVLVHSNESCAGGDGGFEVWNVDDPTNPVHQASVRIDELNEITDFLFGGLQNLGVHNLFLFTQGTRDYVAAVAEGAFDNFQIYEITVPAAPVLVGTWGAEEFFDPGVGDLTFADPDGFARVLAAALWLTDGFGSSANRFLHDLTISDDATRAYLSNWDAGLVLMDISDPTDPVFVSAADPIAGPGGEGNSHAAWPSADGTIVVETTEDFDVGQLAIRVDSGPLAGSVFGGTEDVNGAPPPRFDTVGVVTGELVFVGRLCIGDAVENAAAFDAGDIAVIRRGVCAFSEKLLNAQALGADAGVIANNVAGGPAIGNWTAPDPAITIPGLFISTADGDTIEASPTGNIGRIDPTDLINTSPWGFVRIWDYSDPTSPELASTFNTVNSFNEFGPPDPRGTFSAHNVIVEDLGGAVKAYLSHYSDGVLILDVSDPFNPLETARFHREGPDFEAENGGIQDVWGIYKIPNAPWIYASDRNGGLYLLKEFGSGSAEEGQT